MLTYADLILLADHLKDILGRSEMTISLHAAGHKRFIQRLRDGKGCAHHTAIRALTWFDENWPEDLEWPAQVERPSLMGSSQ